MPDSGTPTPAIVSVPANALVTSLRRDLAAAVIALADAHAGLDTLHAELLATRALLVAAQDGLVHQEARIGPQAPRTAAPAGAGADDSPAAPAAPTAPGGSER